MYNASELFKKAMKAQHRELRCRAIVGDIVLTDTEIQIFDIEDSVLTNDEFRLGTATASAFRLTINNIYGIYNTEQFENKNITIEIGLVLEKFNKDVEFQSLGSFLVEKAEKNEKLIVLTGYDKMVLFDKGYVSNLVYPATLLQIANEICNMTGIKLENKEFINSNYIVKVNPTTGDKKVTLREGIAQLAELACGYACINRNGNLEIVTIKETGEEINPSNYFNFKKDENIVTVNKIIINDVIKGIGDNAIGIMGNIFAQEPEKLIDSIYNAINGFSFLPFRCKWQGNVLLRAGDGVTINDGEGIYSSFIARQKLTYDNGLRSEITTSAKPKLAKDFEYKGTVTKENEVTKEKVSTLKNKADDLEKSDEDIRLNINNTKAGLENKINITASGLTADIKNTKEGLENNLRITAEGLRGDLKNTKEGLEGSLTWTAKNLTTQFQEADGQINSNIEQTARNFQVQVNNVQSNTNAQIQMLSDNMSFKVARGEIISAINMSYEGIVIDSSKLDITGLVTISDLSGGYTTISGDCIRTGSISADRIQGGTIDGDRVFFGDINCQQLHTRGHAELYQGCSVGGNLTVNASGGNDGSIWAAGDIACGAVKSCIQHTENYGDVSFYCLEFAESHLGDKGFGQLVNGECRIDIDPRIIESVNTDTYYHVHLDKYGECEDIWTEETHRDHFIVKGKRDIRFGWTLEGKRRGFENLRLKEVFYAKPKAFGGEA